MDWKTACSTVVFILGVTSVTGLPNNQPTCGVKGFYSKRYISKVSYIERLLYRRILLSKFDNAFSLWKTPNLTIITNTQSYVKLCFFYWESTICYFDKSVPRYIEKPFDITKPSIQILRYKSLLPPADMMPALPSIQTSITFTWLPIHMMMLDGSRQFNSITMESLFQEWLTNEQESSISWTRLSGNLKRIPLDDSSMWKLHSFGCGGINKLHKCRNLWRNWSIVED